MGAGPATAEKGKSSGKKKNNGKKKGKSGPRDRYGIVIIDLKGAIGVAQMAHYGDAYSESLDSWFDGDHALGFTSEGHLSVGFPLTVGRSAAVWAGPEGRVGTGFLNGSFNPSQALTGATGGLTTSDSSFVGGGGGADSSLEYDLRFFGGGLAWGFSHPNVDFTFSWGQLYGSVGVRGDGGSSSTDVEARYFSIAPQWPLRLAPFLSLGLGLDFTAMPTGFVSRQPQDFLPLEESLSAPYYSLLAAVSIRLAP